VSYFCYYTPVEISDLYGDFSLFASNPGQLYINIVQKLGSIMYNFMTFEDCLGEMDGVCAGKKLGTGMSLILNLSAFNSLR